MPHTTETPTAKRPHWLLIVGGILFLLAFLRPDLAQKMAGKPDDTVTQPLHHDGEVVNIVATGNYSHPGQSQTIVGDQIVVRDMHGAEFVIHPHELNTSIPIGTTKLVKTVHDGRLGFSPFHTNVTYEPSYTYNYGSDYTSPTSRIRDYSYVAVDSEGNVTRGDGKPISDAEKEKHLQAHANFLIERVVEKFGANSLESKKLDGMRQHYKSDKEIVKEASKMLPVPIKPLTPEPALPSDKKILREAEEALKKAPAATPTPPKTTRTFSKDQN